MTKKSKKYITFFQRNLTLFNVTEKSAGLYLCTASNDMTRIDIPTVLAVTGIVPSFRGTDSYLAFPTLLNTYLALNVEVHFKPEMADGTCPDFIFLLQKSGKGIFTGSRDFVGLNSFFFYSIVIF